MFGTLIGIFITSTAIIIGADRAVSRNGIYEEMQKTCKTSERSVATIQGTYEFKGASGPFIDFMKTFNAQCTTLSNSTERMPLENQADAFIKKLRTSLQTKLDKIPQKDLEDLHNLESGHIIYVSVSGYEGGTPKVFVRQLVLNKNGSKWEATTSEEPRLSPEPCGARFHGHEKIAKMLTYDPPAYDIIPQEEFDRREVVAVREVEGKQDCSPFIPEQAMELFKAAVRLTIKYGAKVNISVGSVGGTLDCWFIPPTGRAEPCEKAKP